MSGRSLAIALSAAVYCATIGCCATLALASALASATSRLNQGASGGGKGRGALAQAVARYKGAEQVRGMLYERRERQRHRLPQAAGVLSRNQPTRPPGFDIATQHRQGLAK